MADSDSAGCGDASAGGDAAADAVVTWGQWLLASGAFGGLVLLAAATGGVAKKVNLPIITGYMITGILVGPHIFAYISEEWVAHTGWVADAAIAYIAFAAGAEMHLPMIRPLRGAIFKITIMQALVVVGTAPVLLLLLTPVLPFLQGLSTYQRWAVVLMSGVIMSACSPASAIAIVSEIGARGRFTQTALGVTIIRDVVVILLFSICEELASGAFKETVGGGDATFMFVLLAELAVSAVAGTMMSLILYYVVMWEGEGLADYVEKLHRCAMACHPQAIRQKCCARKQPRKRSRAGSANDPHGIGGPTRDDGSDDSAHDGVPANGGARVPGIGPRPGAFDSARRRGAGKHVGFVKQPPVGESDRLSVSSLDPPDEWAEAYLDARDIIRGVGVVLVGYGLLRLSDLMHDLLHFGLETLLTCMVATCVLINKSDAARHRLEESMLSIQKVVYIAFFTHVGVSMNVAILGGVLGVAVLMYGVRSLTTFLGSFLGGWWSGDPTLFNKLSWLCYVTQAGVSLALLGRVKTRFQGVPNNAWVDLLVTAHVALIVMAQLSGPPMFKYAVGRVGEAGQASSHQKKRTELRIEHAVSKPRGTVDFDTGDVVMFAQGLTVNRSISMDPTALNAATQRHRRISASDAVDGGGLVRHLLAGPTMNRHTGVELVKLATGHSVHMLPPTPKPPTVQEVFSREHVDGADDGGVDGGAVGAGSGAGSGGGAVGTGSAVIAVAPALGGAADGGAGETKADALPAEPGSLGASPRDTESLLEPADVDLKVTDDFVPGTRIRVLRQLQRGGGASGGNVRQAASFDETLMFANKAAPAVLARRMSDSDALARSADIEAAGGAVVTGEAPPFRRASLSAEELGQVPPNPLMKD